MLKKYPLLTLLKKENAGLEGALEVLGYDLFTTHSLKKAKEIYLSGREDNLGLIITDLVFPEYGKLEGLRLLSEIRGLYKDSSIPVIGLSENLAHEERFYFIGGTYFLRYPLNIEILIPILKNINGKRIVDIHKGSQNFLYTTHFSVWKTQRFLDLKELSRLSRLIL